MKARDEAPGDARRTLRERAERLLDAPHADFSQIPPEELRRLVHELQVHQVELEIQNEELREAQVELAHARDRYSDLYEFAPVGFATLDANGLVLQANLTCAAMLGVERGRLIGTRLSEFVADESQDHWHIFRRRLLTGDTPPPCELAMRPMGQPGIILELHAGGTIREGAPPTGIRIALADVTARQTAKDLLTGLNIDSDQYLNGNHAGLRRMVERIGLLSEALSNLGEGVLITEGGTTWVEQTIVFANMALCEITGFPAEELVGTTPRILFAQNISPESLREFLAPLAADRPLHREFTSHHKDGTPYDAEIWVNQIPGSGLEDGAGAPRHICIYRDISSRKQAERELRELSDYNNRIFETAQNLILVLDPTGHIVTFNPAFASLSGWSPAEARGMDWFENFIPQRDHQQIRERFANAIESQQTRGKANPVLTRDGGERMIEWYDACLTDSEGMVAGLLCCGTDVTERKRLEQEVINAAEEERQRIARDLHDELGSLLTATSLRATSLGKSLQAIGNPDLADVAATIKLQLNQAIDKTRKISTGLFPLGGHAEDLATALAKLSDEISSDPTIACHFDCPCPVPVESPIVANHLLRIAQEAVNNAVKHSGGTEIGISLAANDGQISLEISDNGSGIAPSDRESKGLGLQIMDYRAAAIGGGLATTSRLGGGTLVSCTAPIS